MRVFDHRSVVDAIERNLLHEPSVPSRNRKMLEAVVPDFEYRPPLWELRAGAFRVFYDVNESIQTVYVRAVRRKRPHMTTQEVVR
jgi:mRNA-degrading endonuclease RelE of RelBE toxin-antitoxin system